MCVGCVRSCVRSCVRVCLSMLYKQLFPFGQIPAETPGSEQLGQVRNYSTDILCNEWLLVAVPSCHSAYTQCWINNVGGLGFFWAGLTDVMKDEDRDA